MTRFLAGLAAVALPHGLSVDIEPFRTSPTGEKILLPVASTSGRVPRGRETRFFVVSVVVAYP